MDQTNFAVIGLGGIGTLLLNTLSRYVNSLGPPTRNILLIDGDQYELKNEGRQDFTDFGQKAIIKAEELGEKFPALDLEIFGQFITRDNVEVLDNSQVIFLCVDNHKTRKVVSDYCKLRSDVLLISGGNELENGNVQVYLRREGKDLTPSLTCYHPEIDNPQDKSPDEMSCEELSKSEPQLLFTNLTVATIMTWTLHNYSKENYEQTQLSEIYFDINTMKVDSKVRKIKNHMEELCTTSQL